MCPNAASIIQLLPQIVGEGSAYLSGAYLFIGSFNTLSHLVFTTIAQSRDLYFQFAYKGIKVQSMDDICPSLMANKWLSQE